MRLSNGNTRGALLALLALMIVAAGWVLLHGPAARTRSDSSGRHEEVAGRSSLPANEAYSTTGAGFSDPLQSQSAVLEVTNSPRLASAIRHPLPDPGNGNPEGVAGAPAPPVYASRFAGRPGYYPPDDPESLSVITGRREAPIVDLELSGGAASLNGLAQVLVAALNAKDESAFDAMRVTKHEFRVICWPEFPESRPVTHITLDDAWLMSATTSRAGTVRTISLHGGRDLELLRVKTKAPFPYTNFVRYSGVVLVARYKGTGEVVRLNFVPSVIERHGRFKVLLYRDR